MNDTKERRFSPPSLEQFKGFVKKIIAVPKAEIEKREEEYKRKRKKQKNKSNASSAHKRGAQGSA